MRSVFSILLETSRSCSASESDGRVRTVGISHFRSFQMIAPTLVYMRFGCERSFVTHLIDLPGLRCWISLITQSSGSGELSYDGQAPHDGANDSNARTSWYCCPFMLPQGSMSKRFECSNTPQATTLTAVNRLQSLPGLAKILKGKPDPSVIGFTADCMIIGAEHSSTTRNSRKPYLSHFVSVRDKWGRFGISGVMARCSSYPPLECYARS
jgi:hypothetical protein